MIRVPLIQGGGIGYDIVPAVQKVVAAAGVQIAWDEYLAGGAADQGGRARDPFPKAMLDAVKKAGFALKTMMLPAPADPHLNYNILLRKELGLYASVRPIKNLRGLPSRFQGVDMLVIRELTEDLYASIEHEVVPGVVQSIKVVTESASKRFFRFAFNWARDQGRKQIHCVHKANILKQADGLFLEAFRSVAKEFPGLTTKEIIVDNCCMQFVSRPQQFDVLAMGNLYGDIVSDLGAGVVGGVSATHGINIGEGIKIFEAFHGGSRESIGMDRANPLPLLLPVIDLLESLEQHDAAKRILRAIETVLAAPGSRTSDLGGEASTSQMTQALIRAL